ncbi:hypothetical protein DFH07DRAFT_779417 [Mycena maculata]|uniref:Uncharacterized protein n=1 Tax=Mycena maculata TaxID=230809 RepID=A0AAD7IA37_9AGAR|nr:hypothetical protein DFH07DRAFT_779417 [Mycena maculata]
MGAMQYRDNVRMTGARAMPTILEKNDIVTLVSEINDRQCMFGVAPEVWHGRTVGTWIHQTWKPRCKCDILTRFLWLRKKGKWVHQVHPYTTAMDVRTNKKSTWLDIRELNEFRNQQIILLWDNDAGKGSRPSVRQTGTTVTKTAVKAEPELSDGRDPAIAGCKLQTSYIGCGF